MRLQVFVPPDRGYCVELDLIVDAQVYQVYQVGDVTC